MAIPGARYEPPLIVIVGPTASGKTGLGVRLAKRLGGEVISADSRAIYEGMDVGSAKPSIEERDGVPHWGFDLVKPGERFTAADFKQYADKKIAEIRARNKVPLLVGGTGLYVDAVLFDYQFGADGDEARRQELETWSERDLYNYCVNNNIKLPENIHNKRYLIRAIEQQGVNNKRRRHPISKSIIVGIATNKNSLRAKITLRAEQILTNGVVSEATTLGKKYGWDNEAMTGNVYPLVKLYLESAVTEAEMKDNFTTLDWQLAKRQLTWFRRNPFIYWGDVEQLYEYVVATLEHKV